MIRHPEKVTPGQCRQPHKERESLGIGDVAERLLVIKIWCKDADGVPGKWMAVVVLLDSHIRPLSVTVSSFRVIKSPVVKRLRDEQNRVTTLNSNQYHYWLLDRYVNKEIP